MEHAWKSVLSSYSHIKGKQGSNYGVFSDLCACCILMIWWCWSSLSYEPVGRWSCYPESKMRRLFQTYCWELIDHHRHLSSSQNTVVQTSLNLLHTDHSMSIEIWSPAKGVLKRGAETEAAGRGKTVKTGSMWISSFTLRSAPPPPDSCQHMLDPNTSSRQPGSLMGPERSCYISDVV